MNVVKSYRALLNLTQRQIAEKLGISISAYNAREIGKTDFKPKEMKKFTDLVKQVRPNVTLEDIFLKTNYRNYRYYKTHMKKERITNMANTILIYDVETKKWTIYTKHSEHANKAKYFVKEIDEIKHDWLPSQDYDFIGESTDIQVYVSKNL